jgi:hypothetical protein
MKNIMKYYCISFLLIFLFSEPLYSQQKSSAETSQQAQSEMKSEAKKEKQKRKKEKKASKDAATISTEPQHGWIFKNRKKNRKKDKEH